MISKDFCITDIFLSCHQLRKVALTELILTIKPGDLPKKEMLLTKTTLVTIWILDLTIYDCAGGPKALGFDVDHTNMITDLKPIMKESFFKQVKSKHYRILIM